MNWSEHAKIQRKEIQKKIEELQAKLKLLEIEEIKKTPCEKAYKDAYGDFPVTDSMSCGDWHVTSWDAFQKGWEASKEFYDKYFVIANSKQEVVEKLQEKEWTYKVTDEKGETNPYKQYMNSAKPENLYDTIADWWDEIFTNGNPSGQNIESLVEKIVKLVPDAIINPDEDCDYGYNKCRYDVLKKFKGW